jgi:hypoxanthine phosphoribosyltransferase
VLGGNTGIRNGECIKKSMTSHLKKELVISRERIRRRVGELGKRISLDYSGKEPVFVGILNGAVFFFADLIRKIEIPLKIDFIRAASYGSGTSSSGSIRFTKDLEIPIQGQPVIVVEDIVDTGLTMKKIVEILSSRGPESVKTCVLIDKRERRENDVAIDYCGFRIEQGFLIGYGLDYNEQYRYLPDIFSLSEEACRQMEDSHDNRMRGMPV